MLSEFVFTETSPAAPGSAASSGSVQNAASYLVAGVAGPLDDLSSLTIVATLQGATGGVLDVYLEFSADGNMWIPVVHFVQLAAAGALSVQTVTLSPYTPSVITTVGSNTTPALAAGAVAPGGWGSRMRMLMVAGSGTSAGAVQTVFLMGQRPEMGRRY
jgi:hypothetical protein